MRSFGVVLLSGERHICLRVLNFANFDWLRAFQGFFFLGGGECRMKRAAKSKYA
jgi:hypothetical protein